MRLQNSGGWDYIGERRITTDLYNFLGHGFLEAVYARALQRELTRVGIRVQREVPIVVWYKDEEVGFYRADLLVRECVLVEVKASRLLDSSAHLQLAHYLKATRLRTGLLLHFGPRPSIKRVSA